MRQASSGKCRELQKNPLEHKGGVFAESRQYPGLKCVKRDEEKLPLTYMPLVLNFPW
jgi:hypothetical protein